MRAGDGDEAWTQRRVTARDGLSLGVRDYAPGVVDRERLPVLCLAGLTRNAADFDAIAHHLAALGHRVVAVDSRGRGRSDYDPDPDNYTPLTEAGDAVAVTDALGLDHYAVIGTSRGGLLAMVIGATRPGQMRRVVLNDIGPVIDPIGLARIKGYLGRAIAPRDWEDAVRIVRESGGTGFPGRTDAAWRAVAEATFVMRGGRLVPDFDPRLLQTLTGLDLSQPLPALWPQFAGLSRKPVLAIRGANSDLLTAETLRAMEERHTNLTALTVPAAGHAPSLTEPGVADAIADFLAR